MGSLPLTQHEAARRTKFAWGATALAGAAAVILFLLPKPRVEVVRDAAPPPETGTRARARVHPTDHLGEQNWTAMTPTLLTLQSAHPDLTQWKRMRDAQIAKAQEQQAQQPEGDKAPQQGGFPPAWRYMGLLWNGRTPLAIVQIDNRQHLVGVGDQPVKNDGFRVESIDEKKIVVSRNSRMYEIERAPLGRGETLAGPSAGVDADAGVFDDGGASRRAPRRNPR